ncbi:MAG: ABC transporter permease [Tissierellia bacterium]|jgi:peptide/nickel transport system permease protein|nr:ABC transporter permease [Tissierellia bacterium]
MISEKKNIKKTTKKKNRFASIIFRFKKNKLALFGLIIFALMVFMAIFADFIVDYETEAIKQNMQNRFSPPSKEHFFGTDNFGRDVFARIVFGARISLFVGIITVGISLFFGVLIGATAGYFGGKVDNILMRIMDVFLAIPQMLMAIAVVAALGTDMFNLLIALSVSQIPRFARIVRSSILTVKGQDYIEAARACGTSNSRIIIKHILPNAIGPITVQATLNVAITILVISALSFVGLGVQPPTPEWGSMMADSKSQLRYHPYLVIIPGIFIGLTVMSLNVIGDGLRDALDPRLKN